jgi:hypothetical protein
VPLAGIVTQCPIEHIPQDVVVLDIINANLPALPLLGHALLQTAPALRSVTVGGNKGRNTGIEAIARQHVDALGRFTALTYAASIDDL